MREWRVPQGFYTLPKGGEGHPRPFSVFPQPLMSATQPRLFVKTGVLKRVSKQNKLLEYKFFLFTDVLIYAKAIPAAPASSKVSSLET